MVEAISIGVAVGGGLATAFGSFRARRWRDLTELQEKLLSAKGSEVVDLEKRIAKLEAKVEVLEDGFADRIADRVVDRMQLFQLPR